MRAVLRNDSGHQRKQRPESHLRQRRHLARGAWKLLPALNLAVYTGSSKDPDLPLTIEPDYGNAQATIDADRPGPQPARFAPDAIDRRPQSDRPRRSAAAGRGRSIQPAIGA